MNRILQTDLSGAKFNDGGFGRGGHDGFSKVLDKQSEDSREIREGCGP